MGKVSILIRFTSVNEYHNPLYVLFLIYLQELFEFLSSKGFPENEHEVVSQFPRRNLSEVDHNTTFKDLGLYPRETVFVHTVEWWSTWTAWSISQCCYSFYFQRYLFHNNIVPLTNLNNNYLDLQIQKLMPRFYQNEYRCRYWVYHVCIIYWHMEVSIMCMSQLNGVPFLYDFSVLGVYWLSCLMYNNNK